MLNQKNRSREILDSFLCCPDEANMDILVSYSRKYDLNDNEILYLANGLANSGDRIRLENGMNVCDIPSTGGPSSLSTLLCPLFLKILGNNVLKLGVPGRPAGGIDVLSQISGYKINPDLKQLYEWINSSSYVHFIASENFTPLDALLFQYRKRTNAVDIPSLVIASLLSKKIAVGLNYVGLDIRVSSFGNFGKTWDEAYHNGVRFNKIANLAGILSKCFLTNGNIPQQPYIGRGEAIVALQKIFTSNFDTYLAKHLEHCFAMANSISINKSSNGYSLNSLREAFYENIRIQEGLISSFEQIAETVNEQHKYNIYASESGVLSIDMEKIRKALLNIQSKSDELFPDNCGLILKAMSNTHIDKGEIICTFRCEDQYKEVFAIDLKSSFGTTLKTIDLNDFEEII
jgi:pyrimidine-nucleoside phosphorylase